MLHRGDRGELSAWRVVATQRREVLAKDLPRFRTGKKTKHIPRQHHNVSSILLLFKRYKREQNIPPRADDGIPFRFSSLLD